MAEHRKIGRALTTCECVYTRGGKADRKYRATLYGTYTLERAQRELRRERADSTLVVLEMKHTRAYYQMDIEEFVEHATVTKVYD